MSYLNRISNSLVSGVNENNFAVVPINLDFSLVQVRAPREFAPLGSALSKDRRTDAEAGISHMVARRLGLLFEQLVPSSPKLISAYGARASEIINTPGLNRQGSQADGPFESFVGIDATSIWAAATSGPASIGVLLLACMLARKFDDAKISTSIWAELVSERKREIALAIESNEIISTSTELATQQIITREELATLDASARSWLNSADQAKMASQKKLMLIMKNIPAFVSTGPSTYAKVIAAWKAAMIGLENLLSGFPQQVSNGAILLALCAWHLYPDMIVLSTETKKVSFKDPLFSERAVVTVGLEAADSNDDQGIRWSLALSHLRYYGDPVEIKSVGNPGRVTMQQFRVVALGALFACWRVAPNEMEDAARWLDGLWKLIKHRGNINPSALIERYSWLDVISSAASDVYKCKDEEREDFRHLLNYGRRRAINLFGNFDKNTLPFLGLRNETLLSSLSEDSELEIGIHYLRNIASSMALRTDQALIVYEGLLSGLPHIFIVTAVPHETASIKRSRDGQARVRKQHARWLMGPYDKFVEQRCKKQCPYSTEEPKESEEPEEPEEFRDWFMKSSERQEHVSFSGLNVTDHAVFLRRLLSWRSPPKLLCRKIGLEDLDGRLNCPSLSQVSECLCFDLDQGAMTEFEASVPFGSKRLFALFTKSNSSIHTEAAQLQLAIHNAGNSMAIAESTRRLSSHRTRNESLIFYLDTLFKVAERSRNTGDFETRLAEDDDEIITNPRAQLASDGQQWKLGDGFMETIAHNVVPATFFYSLEVLDISSQIYTQFPGATIPLRVASQPLYNVRWMPKQRDGTVTRMSRAMTFACIVTIESGGMEVSSKDLTGVMAISSENSIFVSAALLSDPANSHRPSDIRRIIGNIGSPGISLLISPTNPRTRPLGNSYRAILHADFDHKREDKFGGTSLHLSFTTWKAPLVVDKEGFIDQDINYLEAVVSVRDQGTWVADIDVLAAKPGSTALYRADHRCQRTDRKLDQTATSIDCWDELFEPPERLGIFRAHKNWAARLAAVCIAKQLTPKVLVGLVEGDMTCWWCLETNWSHLSNHDSKKIIMID